MTHDNKLSQLQTQSLLSRIPPFEISYETIAHKKFFPSYNLALAIPNGKKYYAWFSFHQSKDVCYLMELNREKKIVDVTFHENREHDLSLGTFVYGTLIQYEHSPNKIQPVFVVEDMYYYRGISLKGLLLGEKLGYIAKFMETMTTKYPEYPVQFILPRMWGIQQPDEASVMEAYEREKSNIQYVVHHIQLRKLMDIAPFLNISLNHVPSQRLREQKETSLPPKIQENNFTVNFSKPQYRYPTVFQVSADIQFDVYHLFACGKNKAPVYYGITCIPNIKTSMMMNKLFRNIRENTNIDYIEESDDESDFENVAEDKYVDLNKTVQMECVFNPKFKKWVPMKVVKDQAVRIIHISKLVSE